MPGLLGTYGKWKIMYFVDLTRPQSTNNAQVRC